MKSLSVNLLTPFKVLGMDFSVTLSEAVEEVSAS